MNNNNNNNNVKKFSDGCADGADEILLSYTERPQIITTKLTQTKNDVISFKVALDKTSFGFFNIFIILITGMVIANVVLETTTMGFVLPVSQCDLVLTNQKKGALMAICYVGIILSSNLWGFLADTKGRRAVIRPTLLVTFLMSVLSSFSNNFWVLLFLRFMNGFFVSGGSATIFAYLGEFHTDRTRSRVMMGAAFIFAVGGMLCPILAYLVINQDWILPIPWLGIVYKPWRLFVVVCGSLGFVCGLALYLLPESPKFLLSIGKESECKQVLQQMYKWNGGKGDMQLPHILPDEDSTETVAHTDAGRSTNLFIVFFRTMWEQTTPLFQRKYLRTTLIICTLQFWLYVATNGMYMWFPHIVNSMAEFISQHPGEPKQMCEIVYEKESALSNDGNMTCITKLEHKTFVYSFTMEALYASMFAFFGLIVNRFGKKKIIIMNLVIYSVCGIAAVLLNDPSIAAYFYVLYFLVGTAINVMSAITVELYPTQMRGMAICVSLMFGRLGCVAGTYVIGLVLNTHCELSFYAVCACLIACAFLSTFLPKIHAEDDSNKKQERADVIT